MKYLLVYLVLISLAIVGCSNDNSPAPTSSVSSEMALPLGKAIPFQMTVAGQGQPKVPQSNRCSLLEMEITGTGIATQLGRLTFIGSHCVTISQNILPFSGGEATITAANGDELHGTYSGVVSVISDMGNVDGQVDITGGTGRFANATGALVMTGTLNGGSFPLQSTLNFDGWIELH